MQLSGLEKLTSWWKRQPALKNGILIIVVCIMLSKHCDSASRILEYMDTTADYCNDFYKFSCGKFINNTVIPDDTNFISSFTIERDKFMHQMKTKIEEEIKANETKSSRLLKTLYRSCMNQTERNRKGITPLLEIVKKLGGWPVVLGDSWNERDFEWQDLVSKIRQYGLKYGYILNVEVQPDYKNNTKNVLHIGYVDSYLARENSITDVDTVYDAYKKYMVDIAVMFGANETRAQQELEEVLIFEMRLKNLRNNRDNSGNFSKLNNPMTVEKLQRQIPSIRLRDYINAILSPDLEIRDDEVIIVNNDFHIYFLDNILESTTKRVQANYLIWRVINQMIPYLSDNVQNKRSNFLTILSGFTESQATWEKCYIYAEENLVYSVGAVYFKEIFDKSLKRVVTEIFTKIREEYTNILENLDWMDEKTRKNALEKIRSMNSVIAYPDEILDDEKLDEYFEKLEITPGDYFQSVLNISHFNINNKINKLSKLNNRTTSFLSDAELFETSNVILFNRIQIDPRILQGIFFSKDRPQYMNYGAIGTGIAHEMMHAFDNVGSQFDKDGNLDEWWEPKTKQKYLSKIQCLIDQYNNYTVEEFPVDGKFTQGENVADHGGLKVAYLAYQKWVEENGPECQLPDLNYTSSQLFWISAAQIWCSKETPEVEKLHLLLDTHSPKEFRVLGSFSNSEEFGKDFNCPPGSAMNRIKKCSLL